MVDCPAPESRTKGKGPLPSMQTFNDSATWPSTVLTVRGTVACPPGRAPVPAQRAEAGGRAKVTSGSTRTGAGPGALTTAASTSTSTVTATATRAAISNPRRRPTA